MTDAIKPVAELLTCQFSGDEAEITWRMILGDEAIWHAAVVTLEWQPEDYEVGITEGYAAESESDVPEEILTAVADRARNGRYDLLADLRESEARVPALAMALRADDL